MTITPISCPLCKLPMAAIGRFASASDGQGAFFVFAMCPMCSSRLKRVPPMIQFRQMVSAVCRMAEDDKRIYPVKFVSDANEGKALFALLKEIRDPGKVLAILTEDACRPGERVAPRPSQNDTIRPS